MLKKNQVLTTEITDYTSAALGVCKVDGFVVFVKGALVGEVCEILILKVQTTHAYAKILKVIEPSPRRVEPKCPVADKCGGCSLWHMDYAEELRFKQAQVEQCFRKIAKSDIALEPIIPAENITGYRNKAQFPVGEQEDGRVVFGFYREKSHDIVAVEECLIQSEVANRLARAVAGWVKTSGVPLYNPDTKTGIIRHILVKTGHKTGQTMLALVCAQKNVPELEKLVEKVLKKAPKVVSVVLNINTSPNNAILGRQCINVYGREDITDNLCGLDFNISPLSFYQTNSPQAEKLYNTALDFAQIDKDTQVLDLYCGTGTITLCAAARAKRAIGIEIVPQAIEDAKENAKMNRVENAEFFCADAAGFAQIIEEKGINPGVVIVDPPRKGLDQAAIDQLLQLGAEKLVYISCNPATLCRDIALLEEGYKIERAVPVDLFPRTVHVETCVLLTHKLRF